MLDFTVFFASKIYPLKESSDSGGGRDLRKRGRKGHFISSPNRSSLTTKFNPKTPISD